MPAMRREGVLLRQVAMAARAFLWLRRPTTNVLLVSLRWHVSFVPQVAVLCLGFVVYVGVLRVVSHSSANTGAGTSRWPDTSRRIGIRGHC